MIPVNFEEVDVILKCFSFDGDKNLLFIFDLIIMIACYYIHKVKWNEKDTF